MNISEWKERVRMEREQKDGFFKIHPQSPIPNDTRERFEGLNYYPPDPDYRFELEFHEHEKKNILEMEDTQGNQRKFIRWGEFRFKVNGKNCTLQAYKNDPQEDRLFLPFRDATSGEETYGAGRYLDLETDNQQTSMGKWIFDFNQAYNPWCAYSKQYACPMVPPENWLKVSIRAGEKNYHKNNNTR